MIYRMTLDIDGQNYGIPVLPETMRVSSPGDNNTARVLAMGEVLLLRHKRLRELSWSAYLPGAPQDHLSAPGWIEPMSFIDALQKRRDEKKPIGLELSGFDLSLNGMYGIESIEYEERAGEIGDIYYTLSLRECKDYSPQRLELKAPTEEQPEPVAVLQEEERPGEPEPQTSHTVVAGDSLWAIAQRFYDDGNRYPELYAKNQAVIDAGNAGTGNSVYTIYPGQVLVL